MDEQHQPMATTGAMVAAPFPELEDHQAITAFVEDLGFRFGIKSFYPAAKPVHTDALLRSLFNTSGVAKAKRLVDMISDRNSHGAVRLAVLRLSGGSLPALDQQVRTALEDDRSVMTDAEVRSINLRKPAPLAPGIKDRSLQQFRAYALWLLRHLQSELHARLCRFD